jgi:hypothetical protein
MLKFLHLSISFLISAATVIVASITSALVTEAVTLEDINRLSRESFINGSSGELLDINSTKEVLMNSDSDELNTPENKDYFMVDSDLDNEDFTNENNNLPETPKKSLDDYFNLINRLDDPQVKTEMLVKLSLKYHEINENQAALDTLNDALEVSKKVENKPSRILLMIDIASAYIKFRELEIASKILDNSLTATQEITAQPEAAALLIDLASKYEQIGDSEKAKTIRSEVENIVAKIENPPPSFPFQPLPLTAKIRIGTNFFSGQNTLLNFSFAVDARKRWETDEIAVNFNFLNSYDNSRNSDEENRIVLDFITQYKHYFLENQYVFVNLAYLQDDFSANESKFSYFTGLGFNFWRGSTNDQTLDMQLGIGDLARNSNIVNTNANCPVVQYALIFRDLLFVDWKFQQAFILEVPVSNTANYYADSRTVLTIPAINNWSIFGSLNFRYFGIPQLDSPNLSTSFSAGLEYQF